MKDSFEYIKLVKKIMAVVILLYIIFQNQLCNIYNVLKKSFFKLNWTIKSVFIDY